MLEHLQLTSLRKHVELVQRLSELYQAGATGLRRRVDWHGGHGIVNGQMWKSAAGKYRAMCIEREREREREREKARENNLSSSLSALC